MVSLFWGKYYALKNLNPNWFPLYNVKMPGILLHKSNLLSAYRFFNVTFIAYHGEISTLALDICCFGYNTQNWFWVWGMRAAPIQFTFCAKKRQRSKGKLCVLSSYREWSWLSKVSDKPQKLPTIIIIQKLPDIWIIGFYHLVVNSRSDDHF